MSEERKTVSIIRDDIENGRLIFNDCFYITKRIKGDNKRFIYVGKSGTFFKKRFIEYFPETRTFKFITLNMVKEYIRQSE